MTNRPNGALYTGLKRLPRSWKARLLGAGNQEWEDLHTSLLR
jgi:predicted GIY-YIG superfamily endonuclease